MLTIAVSIVGAAAIGLVTRRLSDRKHGCRHGFLSNLADRLPLPI
jgi:hypothetical protein